MDDQLKQRLIGATILVVLAVTFVPFLFDEKADDRPGSAASVGPPPPNGIEERPIALPVQPEEEKPAHAETGERAGYRIIPLTDGPSASEAPREPTKDVSGETESELPLDGEIPREFGEDEGGTPAEVPTRDSPLAKPPGAVPARGDTRPGKALTGKMQSEEVKPLSQLPPPPKATTAPVAKPAPVPGPVTKPSGRPSPAVKPTAQKPVSSEDVPATASGEAAKASSEKPASIEKPFPAKSSKILETKKTVRAIKSGETANPTIAPRAGDRKSDGKSGSAVKAAEPVRRDSAASVKTTPDDGSAAKPSPRMPGEVPKATATPIAKKKPEIVTRTAMAPLQPTTSGNSFKTAEPAAIKPAVEAKPSEPVNRAKSEAGPSSWVIQTGSFTSESGAKAFADKLRKNKFTAFVETIPGQQGATYRVQVGPELDRDRAEQLQKRLESSMGVRGILKSRR